MRPLVASLLILSATTVSAQTVTQAAAKKNLSLRETLRFPREGHGIAEPMHRLYLEEEQAKWFDKYVVKSTRAIVP